MQIKKIIFVSTISLLGLIGCLNHKGGVVEPTPSADTSVPSTPSIPTTPTNPTTSNTACDTTAISFDKTIVPILQANCTSCHSGKSPSAGIDLTTYSAVSSVVKSGKLYGAVTHASGYVPMPSSSQFLSNCEILQIKKWIVGGYPNGATVVPTNPTNPTNPVVTPPVTPTPPTTPVVDKCDPNTIYFQQKILPVIVSNCTTSGCHDAKSAKEGIVLTDYKNILKNVNLSKPTDSKVYKYLGITGKDRMPPAPANPVSKDNIDLILKWIQQGAKENSCDASATSCNTTTVTFAAVIMPILQTSCTGCHGGGTPSAGINLSSYAGVASVAKNGKLYGAITHTAGFIAMPSSSSSLSACEISQIKKWIDNGIKND